MDIRTSGPEATPEERAAVDAVLGPPASGWDAGRRSAEEAHVAFGGHAARGRRHLLLPALHGVQDRLGWISRGALEYVCRRLTIPPAEAYGVASFYALLSLEPRPPLVVHVCDDIACRCRGAEDVCRALESEAGAVPGATVLRSPCLGMCEMAPAALVQRFGEDGARPERRLAPATLDAVRAALRGEATPEPPEEALPQPREDRRLLRRIGHVDPHDVDSYRAAGGYRALRRTLDLGPQGVIREVTDSGLMGRGGAAFPTGRKWESVARSPVRPHYLVCNADESEPGTFKDRIVMERDPFALIEAMTIAGVVVGAERGYLYVRGEYPLARSRFERALDAARARGLLGDDVLERGVRFDIEVRRGGGAYICGEETALFNSIEGRRGEPRNKPPFPTDAGLFGRPTAINNVETLINVLDVLERGGAAYAATGTERSTGTRLFCVSGMVERPGLYELPFGGRLRDLLALAGGVRAGHELQAILMGGAAGSFITPEQLDLELSMEAARDAGTTLGSGVVMVFDERCDMGDIVLRIARFFRDESCGQCVPCRVGTVRQEELLHRLLRPSNGVDAARELAVQRDVSQVMRDASICGLGQTASSAVDSALRLGLIGGARAEGGRE